MLNILITAVGGDISQGIIKSLKLSSIKTRLIGTDTNKNSAGLFMCHRGYQVSPATNLKFIKQILSICRKEKISIVFIGNEIEQSIIANNIDYLHKKTNSVFIVQPASTILTCNDKFKAGQILSQAGLRVPKSAVTKQAADNLIKNIGFPVIIKSRHGCGSKYFHILKTKSDLDNYWKTTPRPIIQEYITNQSGDEYTVGLFLNKNSKVLGSITMKRELRFGLTWFAIAKHYPIIANIATLAAETVGAIGPTNVQIRPDQKNNPCIIEINTRISSTAAFRSILGFNEAIASIDYFLKNKKPNLSWKPGICFKTWNELVISPSSFIKKNLVSLNKYVS